MTLILKDKQQEKLNKYIDSSIDLKERISRLSDDLGGVDPNPVLFGVIEEIVSEKMVVKEAYSRISREISEELFSILSEVNEYKTRAAKIEIELLSKEKEINRYCSIYAKVPPLSENKDDPNYSYFLERYEDGLKISQAISQLNFKAVNLLDIQKTLDHTYAGNMICLDYLTNKLEEVVKKFKYVNSPDLIKTYKEHNCSYKKLKEMVDEKNKEFEEVLSKLEKSISNLNKPISNLSKDRDVMSEIFEDSN